MCHNDIICYFFDMYKTLFQNVINFLLKFSTKIKLKLLGKNGKCLVYFSEVSNFSTIYKLFEYNFWWSRLEISDKMNLTIHMIIFNNLKYRDAICLKIRDRFFTSQALLELELKASISSTIKENLLLYCRKFSSFVIALIIWFILIWRSASQINADCNRNQNHWLNTWVISVSK